MSILTAVFQPFRQGDDVSLSLPCHSIDGNGRYYVGWPEKHSILGKPVLALCNGTSAPRRHLSPPCMICHPPTQRLCNRIAVDKRCARRIPTPEDRPPRLLVIAYRNSSVLKTRTQRRQRVEEVATASCHQYILEHGHLTVATRR